MWVTSQKHSCCKSFSWLRRIVSFLLLLRKILENALMFSIACLSCLCLHHFSYLSDRRREWRVMPTGCAPPCWIRAIGTQSCTATILCKWMPSLQLRWLSASTQVRCDNALMFTQEHAVLASLIRWDIVSCHIILLCRENPVWPWRFYYAGVP